MKQPFVTLRDATARALDSAAKQMYVSPTKYKWGKMAQSICARASSPLQKLYAIYSWICRSISYDTDYKIFTADECFDNKKGVCQAYCEMFYHLATSVGLKVVLVVGKVKQQGGLIPGLHAWVLAYTDPNTAILIDPTWGAGSVDSSTGVFTRKREIDWWFNVHPAWMILSHFPNDPLYQLLPSKIAFEQFERLPYVSPWLRKFGFAGHEILGYALNRQPIPMPKCYDHDDVLAVSLPRQTALQSGHAYTIKVKTRRPVSDVRVLGSALDLSSERWEKAGDVATGTFRVAGCGTLSLGIRVSPDSNLFNIVAEYNVI